MSLFIYSFIHLDCTTVDYILSFKILFSSTIRQKETDMKNFQGEKLSKLAIFSAKSSQYCLHNVNVVISNIVFLLMTDKQTPIQF